MTTTPARDALYEALTTGTQHAQIRQHLIDAAIAEDRATHAAEVRAAALTKAADELEHCENYSGDCMCDAAAELRRMAAAARPDCAVCHQPADGHPAVCFPPARPDDTEDRS